MRNIRYTFYVFFIVLFSFQCGGREKYTLDLIGKIYVKVSNAKYFRHTPVTIKLPLFTGGNNIAYEDKVKIYTWTMTETEKKLYSLLALFGASRIANASTSESKLSAFSEFMLLHRDSFYFNKETGHLTMILEPNPSDLNNGSLWDKRLDFGYIESSVDIKKLLENIPPQKEELGFVVKIDTIEQLNSVKETPIDSTEVKNPIESMTYVLKEVSNKFPRKNIKKYGWGWEVTINGVPQTFMRYRNGKIWKINTHPEIRADDKSFNRIDEDGDGFFDHRK